MNRLRTLLAVALAAMTTVTMGQEKKLFTLDDLIPGGSTYRNLVPQTEYLEWWGDECVRLGIDDCSVVDKNTGEQTVLFTLADVNEALGDAKAHHLYYATFPYAGQPVVLLNGNLIDWKQKKTIWQSALEVGAQNKDWHPGSRHTAYTKDYNLYVAKADGKTFKVSTDGSIDLVYGEAVHRNEFGIDKGTFWSPSGSKLAFYRMDQSMVAAYPQVDMTTRCATVVPDKYPMAGEPSHKVSVGVYDVEAGTTIYLNTDDPTDRYFTNIAWSPDGKLLYIIEMNRDQTIAQLIAYDAQTGAKKGIVLEEKNDKYIEPMNPIVFLPWDGDKFIYQSRNEGYKHIYLYSADGKMLKRLTSGEFEVMDVLGFNEKKKSIVYTSNEGSPIGKTVWSVDVKGRRTPVGSREGWHSAELSATGTFVADMYSSPKTARKIDIVPTAGGKSVNVLTAAEPWDEYKTPQIEVGTIKAADGKTD